MQAPAEQHPGLLASGRRLLATLLGIARNRLELLLVEVQEERARVIEAFILTAAIVAFGSVTLALVTFTVLAWFWETHRLAALVGLSLLYLAVTVAASWRLHHRLRTWVAFADTLAELKKDKAWLDDPK